MGESQKKKFVAAIGAIPCFLKATYAVYLFAVLIATIAIAPFIDYAWKTSLTAYNAILAFLALAIGLTISMIEARRDGKQQARSCDGGPSRFGIVIAFGSVILFIVQIIIFLGCRFETGWDVMRLVQMDNDARTIYSESLHEYYSIYPNQLFLGGLFRRIGLFASWLGIADTYSVLTICGMLCVNISIVLSAYVAKEIAGQRAGFFAFVTAALLAGCNPWILVPYSDAYAMPFTTLQIWAYLCIKRGHVRWPIITASAIIGYCIKPTAVFVLVGICIVDFCHFIQQKHNPITTTNPSQHHVGELAKTVFITVLSCVLAIGFTICIKDFGISIDYSRSFGVPHYLMMGANDTSYGAFNSDDVGISLSADNVQERNQKDLAEWRARVSNKGITGLAVLAFRKSLTNYSDGTFAFGKEGEFYLSITGDDGNLKRFFGIGYSDKPFAVFAQILWYLTLFGALRASIPRKTASYKQAALSIALLSLSVFLMVFECRARYLYLYVPLFIVASSIGWFNLSSGLLRKRISQPKA